VGLNPPESFAPVTVFGFDDLPKALDRIGVNPAALGPRVSVSRTDRSLNPFPFFKLVVTVKEAVWDGVKATHFAGSVEGGHAGRLAVFGAGRWVSLGEDEEFFLDWVEHGHV
jgi:hypothetical protein